jgi:signal transduction histidine kinase
VPFKIRHIATRFALLLGLAAVLPLIAYGIVSILSLQRSTRETAIAGHRKAADLAVGGIRRYIVTNAAMLKALAADLQNTGLDRRQQDQILKNYVVEFPAFREITLFAEDRTPVVTSRAGKARVAVAEELRGGVPLNGVWMSPIAIDEEALPTATFVVHLRHLNEDAGWLAGEINLEEMWRFVESVRIGEKGFALVVAPGGELIAHGNPEKQSLVAKAVNLGAHPLIASLKNNNDKDATVSLEYADDQRERQLGVAAWVPQLGWIVAVEQPTVEAYAAAATMQRILVIAISAALLAMVAVGYLFGRSFINPILTLKRGTQKVASGALDTRVQINTRDEFGELGDSFNTMAGRLAELQEDVKKQERQAMFGRVAAGLVHDLLHPIQNVGNNTRLLMRDDLDVEGRQECGRLIDRELTTIRRFLDDLRNVVKPKPVERHPMDINVTVAEIVESMRQEGDRHGILVDARYGTGALIIDGDRFALGRVFRNLITNAIQATQPGGSVTVATQRTGDHVQVSVTDTGSGIPADRLSAIFDDFVTTKRRGLGLGLAISKRIVEQLDGTILVESEVGRGTAFTLKFPARDDESARVAAS